MITVYLTVLPGPGRTTLEVSPGTSVADISADRGLQGRSFILDGVQLDANRLGSTVFMARGTPYDLHALQAVKGA